MTVRKFKSLFKHPINVQANSPQAEAHRQATPETHPNLFGETLYCVIDGRVFRKMPKHYTGVINQRVRGGKWEEVFPWRGESIERMITERFGAVEADFRGAPRVR